MAIGYGQKHLIINYLSDAGNWENRFDMAALLDDRRCWSSQATHDAAVSYNPEHSKASVSHSRSGSEIMFKDVGNGMVMITDETGLSVLAGRETLNAGDLPEDNISYVKPAELREMSGNAAFVELANTALSVRFDVERRKGDNGKDDERVWKKVVMCRDNGRVIEFPAAGADRPVIQPMRFSHVLTFDTSSKQKWLGLSHVEMMNSLSLILSRDMGIEPELAAQNELDVTLLMQAVSSGGLAGTNSPDAAGRVHVPGNVSRLCKHFDDATDFKGFFVETPKQFLINGTGSGFELWVSLDNREWICSHGAVMKAALNDPGIMTSATNEKPDLPTIMKTMLEKGCPVADHRGEEWLAVKISGGSPQRTAANIRNSIRGFLGVPGYDFVAAGLDEGVSVLSMRTAALTSVNLGFQASRRLFRMVNEKSTDYDAIKELLESGADLRHVDPKMARSGYTFANLLKNRGYGALVAEMQNEGRIHDLGAEGLVI